jgi:hypothetical protein
MKKIRKIFIALILIFILIFAITLILAKTLITPENIKNLLSHESAKYLGTEIKAEKVHIKYLKEIRLEGVTLKSVNGVKEDLFTCSEIDIKYGLFPLLLKKLLIKEIYIKDPAFNFILINGRIKNLPQGKTGDSFKKPSLGLLFLPDAVNIVNGKISLETEKASFSLENLMLSAEDISVVFPFRVSISANLPESKDKEITCETTINVLKKEADCNIKIDKVPIKQLSAFLEAQEITLKDGFLSIDSNISYHDPEVMIQGSASLNKASVELPVKYKRLKMQDINSDIKFKASYLLPEKKLTIEDITGSLLSQKFAGKGSVVIKPGRPVLDLSIASDDFSLKQLFDRIDIDLESPFYGLSISGNIGIKAAIKGTPGKNISPIVSINLKSNRIIYPPLANLQPEFIGNITLDKRNISIKTLSISALGSSVTFTGNIPDYTTWPPRTNLKVTASKLNLNPLFNEDPDLSGPEPLEDIGPFNFKKFSSKGPLKLGNTYLLGMPLNNVGGEYVFENNIFSINNLAGNIGNGKFNLSAKVDLGVEGLDYYLHLTLKDTEVDSLSAILPPDFRKHVKGLLSGSCAVKGSGTSPVNLNNNLKADVMFFIKDGLLMNLKLKPPLSTFIAKNKLKSIPLRTGTFNARLRNSIFDIDIEIISEDLEFFSEGDVYLDTSLDLDAKIKISEEFFKGDRALARLLPRESSLISVPFTIKGTLDEPVVSLPEETFRSIIKEIVPNLIMDLMNEDKKEELGSTIKEILDIFSGSSKE